MTLSDPLPSPSTGGKDLSTRFIALIGAIAGGSPQLVIPTSTIVELIGNTLMGALVVAVIDKMLIQQTLQGPAVRRGRILLIVFVSVTLTIVTYKPASLVFQTVFDAPPPRQVQQLSVASFTHERLGNVGYRMSFVSEPLGIAPMLERMESLKDAAYDEYQFNSDWRAYLAAHIAGQPFYDAAATFKEPTGYAWETALKSDPNRKARTVLLYDRATGRAFVLHTAG